MHLCRTLVCMLALAGLVVPGAAEAADEEPSALAYAELESAWAKPIASVRAFEAALPELLPELLDAGAKLKVLAAKKAHAEYAALHSEVASQHPGMSHVWSDLSSEQQIRTDITKRLTDFDKQDPRKCFAGAHRSYRTSKTCEETLQTWCGQVFSRNGELQGRILDDELDVATASIENVNDFQAASEIFSGGDASRTPTPWEQVQFAFCKAVAASGTAFDFGGMRVPKDPPWEVTGFVHPFLSESDFREKCGGQQLAGPGTVLRLARALADLPKRPSFARTNLEGWRDRLVQHRRRCFKAAAHRCADTYFVKDDTPI